MDLNLGSALHVAGQPLSPVPGSPSSPGSPGKRKAISGVDELRAKASTRKGASFSPGRRVVKQETEAVVEEESVLGEPAVAAKESNEGQQREETSPTPGQRARTFLQATGAAEEEADVEAAFDKIMREGSMKIRSGRLDTIQKEVLQVRRSQRDMLKSVRDAKKASEAVDYAIDNSMRRFTIANAVISKMSERCEQVRETTFIEGSSEFEKWNALRSHTQSVLDKVRKTKLRRDVEKTREMLDRLKEADTHSVPRRVTL